MCSGVDGPVPFASPQPSGDRAGVSRQQPLGPPPPQSRRAGAPSGAGARPRSPVHTRESITQLSHVALSGDPAPHGPRSEIAAGAHSFLLRWESEARRGDWLPQRRRASRWRQSQLINNGSGPPPETASRVAAKLSAPPSKSSHFSAEWTSFLFRERCSPLDCLPGRAPRTGPQDHHPQDWPPGPQAVPRTGPPA